MIDVKALVGHRRTEDMTLEAKRAAGGLPESVWETYSAFANAAGGVILLGVEELPDHTLRTRGVPDAEEMARAFWDRVNDPAWASVNVLSPEQVYVQTVDGRDVVVIEVPPARAAEKPVHLFGDLYRGSYVRVGEADCRCGPGQVDDLLRESGRAPAWGRWDELPREKLLELMEAHAKNWLALDGVWFQSVEERWGMEEAMLHDARAWERYTVIEARRIKDFLGLPERAGLEGLRRALGFRLYAALNAHEFLEEEGALVYRVTDCRVQQARARKGMPWHPCKSVGLVEYGGFARTIDPRIETACLRCYPDPEADDGCCAWRFTLKEDE